MEAVYDLSAASDPQPHVAHVVFTAEDDVDTVADGPAVSTDVPWDTMPTTVFQEPTSPGEGETCRRADDHSEDDMDEMERRFQQTITSEYRSTGAKAAASSRKRRRMSTEEKEEQKRERKRQRAEAKEAKAAQKKASKEERRNRTTAEKQPSGATFSSEDLAIASTIEELVERNQSVTASSAASFSTESSPHKPSPAPARSSAKAKKKVVELSKIAFRQSHKELRRSALSLSVQAAVSNSLASALKIPTGGGDTDAQGIASAASPPSGSTSATVSSFPSHVPFPAGSDHASPLSVGSPVFATTDASETSSVFSPTSPASPSGWSSVRAANITSRFLAAVQTTKKQTLERLLSKDSSNGAAVVPASQSQRLLSRAGQLRHQLHGVDAASNSLGASHATIALGDSAHDVTGGTVPSLEELSEEELVIGGDEEEANWLPAGAGSFKTDTAPEASAHTVGDAAHDSQGLLLSSSGQVSSFDIFYATSSLEAQDSTLRARAQGLDTDEETQREEARTLARKHEMLRLQKKLQRMQSGGDSQQSGAYSQGDSQGAKSATDTQRTQSLPDTATESAGLHSRTQQPTTSSAATDNSPAHMIIRPLLTPGVEPSAGKKLLFDADATDSNSNLTRRGNGSFKSLREMNLSMSDLNLIRKQNSFENTSSQRVSVFTKSTKKNLNENSNGH